MSPWVARMTSMSNSSYGWRSVSAGGATSTALASASVPPSISRSMRILNS